MLTTIQSYYPTTDDIREQKEAGNTLNVVPCAQNLISVLKFGTVFE